jgi:hypothetical protein
LVAADAVDVVGDGGVVLGRWGSWAVGMAPGVAARARRLEALERAEQLQRAAEAQERADLRLERWAVQRMREMSFSGEPYDAGDWRTLARSPEQVAERVFAAMAAEDRVREVRQKIEAGELVLLDAQEVTSAPATPREDGSPPSPVPVSAARARLLDRITAFAHRTAGGLQPCPCPTCVRVRAARQADR